MCVCVCVRVYIKVADCYDIAHDAETAKRIFLVYLAQLKVLQGKTQGYPGKKPKEIKGKTLVERLNDVLRCV